MDISIKIKFTYTPFWWNMEVPFANMLSVKVGRSAKFTSYISVHTSNRYVMTFKRNFIVFLKNQQFHFNLVYSDKKKNQSVTLKEAKPCFRLTLLKETKDYQLFDCPKSLFVINKQKGPIDIDGILIKDRAYLSKGPTLYWGKKAIYERGRALWSGPAF